MNEKLIIKPSAAPRLPALFAFECVARHMNFARAADEMGVTPTAISRTIRVLEEQMQVRLFNRTTRSVALTEAGAQLMQSLSPALAAIRESVAHAGAASGRPSGNLRINASHVAYTVLIKPRLQGFLQTFPEITLDLALDNRLSDVTGAGFDAGIRLGHALHRDMIAVRLGSPQRRTVVASPVYLAAHGEPRKPEDLLAHACIRQRFPASDRFFEWKFTRSVQIDVQGQLVFDEMRSIAEAAAAGLGVAYVFDEFAAAALANGALKALLEKYRPPGESFYLYYPNRSHMPGKLRAFIDYFR